VKLIVIQNPQKGKVTSFARVPWPTAITIYHKEKSFFVVSKITVHKINPKKGIFSSSNPSIFSHIVFKKGSSILLLGMRTIKEIEMVWGHVQDSRSCLVLQLIN
jgi:hypothetical protein